MLRRLEYFIFCVVVVVVGLAVFFTAGNRAMKHVEKSPCEVAHRQERTSKACP
jgi:hypothetical protein